MPDKYYKETIWTNHALARLTNRKLPQNLAYKAFQHPDETFKNSDGSFEYRKRFGLHLVTVIAKQNERKQWVIISCWIDPPMKGTEDHIKRSRYYEYKNASWLKRLWIDFRKNVLGQDY